MRRDNRASVDGVTHLDLMSSKWCVIIFAIPFDQHLKDHFLMNFLHDGETQYGFENAICCHHTAGFHSWNIDVPFWNSQLVSHLTQLNWLLIALQQAYLRAHVRTFFFFSFFLKQYLVELIPWHPTCLPTPTTNRQWRCYIRGLGADPWGWGLCSVLVGMSEGLYKITKA